VNSLVALLLMNLLMLSERHLEALHIFEQHRSVLVRDKDIVTLAAVGLYKTGTPEALRQVRPSSQEHVDPSSVADLGCLSWILIFIHPG
jgi:hypothetical protein